MAMTLGECAELEQRRDDAARVELVCGKIARDNREHRRLDLVRTVGAPEPLRYFVCSIAELANGVDPAARVLRARFRVLRTVCTDGSDRTDQRHLLPALEDP